MLKGNSDSHVDVDPTLVSYSSIRSSTKMCANREWIFNSYGFKQKHSEYNESRNYLAMHSVLIKTINTSVFDLFNTHQYISVVLSCNF